MEAYGDQHEMQEIHQPIREAQEEPESLISEMGITRRKIRTLHSNKLRPSKRNIASLLPSHLADGALFDGQDVTDGLSTLSTSTNSYKSNVEIRAEEIVRHIERKANLMDDNPKSEIERIITLREMTEGLTLKRSVKRKLVKSVGSKSKPISLYKRMKYRTSIFFSKLATSFKNFLYSFELWYSSLKTIESHFGSSVATYFKFLRRLFILNILVFITTLAFIIVPQLLFRLIQVDNEEVTNSTSGEEILFFPDLNGTDSENEDVFHKSPLIIMRSNPYEENDDFRFGNIFTGEGFLRSTVLFYGYYTNMTLSIFRSHTYHIPTAYFFSSLFCYFMIFLTLSVSMASSYRKSFIETSGGVKNVFANKVFCGWDFGIATRQTADLRSKTIYMELKELLDEQSREKKGKSCFDIFYVLMMQISLNALLLLIMGTVGFYSWKFLDEHMNDVDTATSMMISLVLTIVIIIGPIFFSWIVRFEEYDTPRSALYMTLIRTFILDAIVIAIVLSYRLSKSAKTECWETTLGQEVYRLVLLDFIFGLIGTTLAEFIRNRIFQKMWKGIGCPEFDIARNTMNLIYNQTLFYVGLYFSPILSLVIILKMFLTFYIKKWGAIYNCKPSSKPWRAAQTHTVFLIIAFLAFFAVLVLYGYILTSVMTSDCGPFRGKKIMYESVLNEIFTIDGKNRSVVVSIILYITKPGIVAIVLMTMLLAVYYLRSISLARKHVVDILRDILILQANDKKFMLEQLDRFQKKKRTENGDYVGNIYKNYNYNKREDSKPDENLFDEHDSSVNVDGIENERRKSRELTDNYAFKKLNRFRRGDNGLFRSTQNIANYDNEFINSNRKYFQSAQNIYDDFSVMDTASKNHASTSKLMEAFEQRCLNGKDSSNSEFEPSSSRNYGYQNDDELNQEDFYKSKKINFNPVYTESRSFYSDEEDSDNQDNQTSSQRHDESSNISYSDAYYDGEQYSRNHSYNYDDRIPSRIGFDYKKTPSSNKRY